MRAVNLIPVDQRRGSSGPGRSGTAVYLLLGGLAVLVLAVSAFVLTSNQVNDRRAHLAQVEQQASAAEAQAAALRPYRDFAALGDRRIATIRSLVGSRFDWERALHQLSRVLPTDVWLTSLSGTVAPGVGGGAGAGDSGALRGQIQAPALELAGCTSSQSAVSRVLARLRRMDGVQRVSLASSDKGAMTPTGTSGPSATTSASSGDCRGGSDQRPQFSLVIFFDALPTPQLDSGTAPAQPGTAGAAAQPQAVSNKNGTVTQ